MILPKISVRIKWGSTWALESSRLVSFTFGKLVIPEKDVLPKSGMFSGTLVLQNTDWRFSPRTGKGVDTAIHADIKAFPIEGYEIVIALENISIRLFTGRITAYSFNETGAEVTFTIQHAIERYIQRPDSSGIYAGYSVHDLVNEYATIAEMSASHTVANSTIDMPYAWLGKDNALTDIQEIADATLSYVYPHIDGNLLFDTYDSWYTKQALPEILSPSHNYEDLETAWDAKRLATDVVVEYSPRDIGLHTEIYNLDEVLYSPANIDNDPAGISKTFILKTSKPIFLYDEPEAGVDYGVSLGSGIPAGTAVTVSFKMLAQEIHLTITNHHQTLEAIMEWFRLKGVAIVGKPSRLVENEFAPTQGFKRTRNIVPRFYMQHEAHADWVKSVAAQRLPNSAIGVKVVGIPISKTLLLDSKNSLQIIGTRVKYQRYNDTTSPTDAHVVGYVVRYATGKLSIDVTLINRSVLYPHENYGILAGVPSGNFAQTDTVFC